MPIYEYRCTQCGKISEFLVGIGSEDTELKCRHCGSEELVKMISTSFVREARVVEGHNTGRLVVVMTSGVISLPVQMKGFVKGRHANVQQDCS